MKIFKVAILFIFFYCSLNAQIAKQIPHKINWQHSPPQTSTGIAYRSLLNFEGAVFIEDQNALPLYFDKILIDNNVGSFQALLSAMVFEEIKEIPVANEGAIGAEIVPKTHIVYERKIPFGIISFIPIRKNTNGKFEKLISFNLEIIENKVFEKKAASAKTYAASSVLKSGNWYKIAVANDGVYKLDYSFLTQMGLSLPALNPKNIRIYGNGGGLLPFKNSDFRYDDLVENAIYIAGEADGKFDNVDYILFYGQGPHRWYYNETSKKFEHTIHSYSDSTYYFISADQGMGKRISDQAAVSGAVTNVVNKFDDFYYHEENSVNLLKSGREWYGEAFDIVTSRDFNFTIPNLDPSTQVLITTNVIAHSPRNATSFDIKANQDFVMNIPLPLSGTLYWQVYANQPDPTTPITKGYNLTVPDLTVNLSYNRLDPSSIAWLDNIEINARRNLIMTGNQMNFRDRASVGPGKISQFYLSGASSGTTIWDVSNPVNVKQQIFQNVSSQAVFTALTDTLKEFVAFNGLNFGAFKTATFSGKIENQNLHAIGQRDMIIVVYPAFLKEANRLADFHRSHDSLKVEVVALPQIYNEFASGCQDITAIRDFMKMLYDRAGTKLPKHLLLFGDASYNYKNIAGNTNFVPSYEAKNSLSPTLSYVTDDYYVSLDDNEGVLSESSLADFTQPLDLNVGRFPVQTSEQSANVVDKIIHYVVPPPIALTNGGGGYVCENNSGGGATLGDWRNVVCFVADAGTPDIGDINVHETQANSSAKMVDSLHKDYNVDKIYLEAYNRVSTPGGFRFPDAKNDLNNRVDKGALVINYTGHGGELGWSASRVLEIADIDSWSNFNKMPLFMTATCEFSRFDNPERTSAGELVLLKKNGGGIALLTTVRLVYSDKNAILNEAFYNNIFKPSAGTMPSLGDVFTRTKNEAGGNRNFTLLGDPAITLAYPVNKAVTKTVNNKSVLNQLDTLTALSKVTISGSVTNSNGQKLNNYNGILYPTVYDKPDFIANIGFYDPPGTPEPRFSLQKNILYKGKASVTNGDFSFTFLIPKDISYRYGFGKISYYTENGLVDGNGFFDKVVIGGSPRNVQNDTKGPGVKLYMNDEKFISGGTTDENPVIRAFIADSSGINTVGNGIGHDITAILDGDASHVLVLNDYYQADLNSYQHGKVSYKLARLKEGKHTLKFKVWDVYNNSSETYLEFVVSNAADFALNHVLNYPNPFTTKTSFYFEHNKPCTLLDIQIQVYTLSGRLIKTIEENRMHSDGYRIGPIDWDGRDDFGDKIARGLYVYRVKVHSLSDGSVADKYEKLVILN